MSWFHAAFPLLWEENVTVHVGATTDELCISVILHSSSML